LLEIAEQRGVHDVLGETALGDATGLQNETQQAAKQDGHDEEREHRLDQGEGATAAIRGDDGGGGETHGRVFPESCTAGTAVSMSGGLASMEGFAGAVDRNPA